MPYVLNYNLRHAVANEGKVGFVKNVRRVCPYMITLTQIDVGVF